MPAKKTHGMTNTRFYRIYRGIINRCTLPSDSNYRYYGERGIKCEWRTFKDFLNTMYRNYLIHVREYGEDNTTIDRIDVNGNYCIENCRWATVKEQLNNTRVNVSMEYNGIKYKSIEMLCEHLGLKYNTLYKRVFINGQDTKQAIDEMINKRQKYKYKGVSYKGITDICRKLGLKRTSITYRLKMGMSIEDAIEKEFRPYIKL